MCWIQNSGLTGVFLAFCPLKISLHYLLLAWFLIKCCNYSLISSVAKTSFSLAVFRIFFWFPPLLLIYLGSIFCFSFECILLGVLWPLWICSLVSVINFRKFLGFISSYISSVSLFFPLLRCLSVSASLSKCSCFISLSRHHLSPDFQVVGCPMTSGLWWV